MAKTRNVQIAQVMQDGADDLSVTFYIADATDTTPAHPRVVVTLKATPGTHSNPIDRPLSDYTTLTGPNKVTLRNLLTAIRDQAFTLEGFA